MTAPTIDDSAFDPDAKAVELEKELKALDALHGDYLKKRSRYIMAIRALKGLPPPQRITPRPVSNAVAGNAASPNWAQVMGEISRIDAIDEAIRALPKQFTTTHVRDYVASKYPDLVEGLAGGYLPTRLAYLVDNGQIRLVEGGRDGKPNIWMRP